MVREILYRAKSIIADDPNTPGYWLRGYAVMKTYRYDECSWDTLYVIDSEYSELDETTEVWPETIGQFTGLTDKNGNKIFEGDIVKTKYGRLCEVVWFDSRIHMGWDLKPVDTQENIWHTQAPDTYDIWDSKNLEVVGNMWDKEG